MGCDVDWLEQLVQHLLLIVLARNIRKFIARLTSIFDILFSNIVEHEWRNILHPYWEELFENIWDNFVCHVDAFVDYVIVIWLERNPKRCSNCWDEEWTHTIQSLLSTGFHSYERLETMPYLKRDLFFFLYIYFITCLKCLIDVIDCIFLENLHDEEENDHIRV